MRVNDLEFSGFRNLVDGRIGLGDRFNLLVGDNAQGKTNLLEAVCILSELRSFRNSRLEDVLGAGVERARLFWSASSSGLDYRVAVELGRGSKRLQVNGKVLSRRRDYLGKLPVVVFTPEDVGILKGRPEPRRRFLDRALFLIRPSHWERSSEYRKVLKRRNLLLKERRIRDPLFDVYSERLAALGSEISFERRGIVDLLNVRVADAVRVISDSTEEVRLSYRSQIIESKDQTASDGGGKLIELLRERVPSDIRRGWTSVGPHREDLVVELDGRAASAYASQGQHRSLALALKIAETEVIHRATGIFPLLLIDDLSSELDAGRRKRLFAYLRRTGGQILLTSTDPGLGGDFQSEGLMRFCVEGGKVRRIGDD